MHINLFRTHTGCSLLAASHPRVVGNVSQENAWHKAANRKLAELEIQQRSAAGNEPAQWADWEHHSVQDLAAHHVRLPAAQGDNEEPTREEQTWEPSSRQIGDPVSHHPLQIRSFDPLPGKSLDCFPPDRYLVTVSSTPANSQPAAIMVHNYSLTSKDIPESVCCISRFGSGGIANVPIGQMTERGIPVFTTPASNANAVKEAVVCALFLVSRGILEGAAHYRNVILKEETTFEAIEARMEEDAWMFDGTELRGKTLGVIGLGNVGSRVAAAALALDMDVIGYDPWLSADSISRLPSDRMRYASSLEALLSASDYITVHVHYFNVATHHLLNSSNLCLCKPGVQLINFSPARVIDGEAVRDFWQQGRLRGKYVSDFADPALQGHPRHLVLPHIGALTSEALLSSACTAVTAVSDFLETGAIHQSVNFPVCRLERMEESIATGRLCLVVQSNHEPGLLGKINTFLEVRGVIIETQVSATKGDLAYLLLDVACVGDVNALLVCLADEVRCVISSRYIDYSIRGVPRSTFASSRAIWEHDDEPPDFEVADWGSAEGTECDASMSKADFMTETWPDEKAR